MAAGLVPHNITTATGVTFAVVSWVPDTTAPNVGAVPVIRVTDGVNVAPVSTTTGLKVDVGARGAGATTSDTIRVTIAEEQVDKGHYVPCPVSATTTLSHPTGGTGAVGDFISSLLITPTSLNPGAVEIKDGGGTAITIFSGGTDSVSNFASWTVGLGYVSVVGPWQVITGSGIKVVAGGAFSA